MGRAQTGIGFAGLLLTAAVLAEHCTALSLAFIVLSMVTLIAMMANRLPLLHEFPLIGAPKTTVTLSLEGRSRLRAGIRKRDPIPLPEHIKAATGMQVEVPPVEPRDLHLQVGIRNRSRWPITNAIVTFMHSEGIRHVATGPHGEGSEHGRWMPPTSESLKLDDQGRPVASDYWVWRGDLPAASLLFYFRLIVDRAGDYPVRVKISAGDLYDGVVFDATITVGEVAQADEPPSDALSYAIQQAEDVVREVERTDQTVDTARVMAAILMMTRPIPEDRDDVESMIVKAPVEYTGAQYGREYDAALLRAKIRAAYEARRRLGDDHP